MAGGITHWQREYRARRVAQFGGEAQYQAWLEQRRANKQRLADQRARGARAFAQLVELATSTHGAPESVPHHQV